MPRITARKISSYEFVRLFARLVERTPRVDPDKTLRLWGISEQDAPIVQLNDNTHVIGKIGVQESLQRYINAVTVVSDDRFSEVLFHSFSGDNQSRSFELPSDLWDSPDITINGVESVVGIDGTAVWRWSEGSNIIEHSSSEVILADDDEVAVRYRTLVPVQARRTDPVGIATRGIYEETIYQNKITEAEAVVLAEQELRRKNKVEQRVIFTIVSSGWRVGQRLDVNLPDQNAVGDFIVYRRALSMRGTEAKHDIEANNLDGPDNVREFFNSDSVADIVGDRPLFDDTDIPVDELATTPTDALTVTNISLLRFANLGENPVLKLIYSVQGQVFFQSCIEPGRIWFNIDFGLELGATPYTLAHVQRPAGNSGGTLTTSINGKRGTVGTQLERPA